MAQHAIHSDDLMIVLSRSVEMPFLTFPPFVIPDHRTKLAYGRHGEVFLWRRPEKFARPEMSEMRDNIERALLT